MWLIYKVGSGKAVKIRMQAMFTDNKVYLFKGKRMGDRKIYSYPLLGSFYTPIKHKNEIQLHNSYSMITLYFMKKSQYY